ncbi:MAG TPA: hypothetical protein VMF06_07965 [Candidatus Limnocylindria bacterium]|nr:hypothetical protein [Candidatus Limnocylindria bacterium]
MNQRLKPTAFLAAGLCFASSLSPILGAETGKLEEHLESLRPFLGRTWRGEFKDSKPEKPLFDISHWERILNGQAVRITHSVNDGAYGGETIIRWDKDKGQLAYHYFTTAGFSTEGTLTVTGTKFTATEKVTGEANGITEVRSTSEIRADGTMLSKAEYIKGSEVSGGREILYKEDPKAEVKFK